MDDDMMIGGGSDDEDGFEDKKQQQKAKKANPSKKRLEKAGNKGLAMGGSNNVKAKDAKVMMNFKQAYAAVAEYMHVQNRPYNVQNVMDNHGGTIPRKICEDVLAKLAQE